MQNTLAALEELFNKRVGQIKPGLERMHEALERLPYLKGVAPVVLVGGTNGKGSTSGMLWHLLSALGVKTGLFTSPHLVSFSERIQLSHKVLSDDDLVTELYELRSCLSSAFYDGLSFFEVITLLALNVFHKNQCDFNIFEVGLGGRWDATNVLEPFFSIITSIGLDHQEYLGDTLSQIAKEKLGITRKNCLLIWGEQKSEVMSEIRPILESSKKDKGFLLAQAGRDFFVEGNKVVLKFGNDEPLVISFPCWVKDAPYIYQANFALAMRGLYEIISDGRYSGYFPKDMREMNSEAILNLAVSRFATRGIPWPPSLTGRFQVMKVHNPANTSVDLILDGCHNLPAVQEFVRNIKDSDYFAESRKIPGLVSFAADKDISAMVPLLKEVLEPLVFFKMGHSRSIKRENIIAYEKQAIFYDSFDEAFHFILNRDERSVLAICGSFMAVGEVIRYFDAYPKKRDFSSTLEGVFTFTK